MSSSETWHRLPVALLQRSIFGRYLSPLEITRLSACSRYINVQWCIGSGPVWECVASRDYPDHRLWRSTQSLRPAVALPFIPTTATQNAPSTTKEGTPSSAPTLTSSSSNDSSPSLSSSSSSSSSSSPLPELKGSDSSEHKEVNDSSSISSSLPPASSCALDEFVTTRMERTSSGNNISVRIVDWKRVCKQMSSSLTLFTSNIDTWENFIFENLAPLSSEEATALSESINGMPTEDDGDKDGKDGSSKSVVPRNKYESKLETQSQVIYAGAISKFILQHLRTVDKPSVTSFLCNVPKDKYYRNAFCIALANSFDYRGLKYDWALRSWLGVLWIPNSAAGLRRMLRAFSSAFGSQHPNAIEGINVDVEPSAWRKMLDPARNDAGYLLCWTMMILSADLHNPRVKQKQSESTFISLNKEHGLLSQQSMIALYRSIQYCPILWRLPSHNHAGWVIMEDGRNWYLKKQFKMVWIIADNQSITIKGSPEDANVIHYFDFKSTESASSSATSSSSALSPSTSTPLPVGVPTNPSLSLEDTVPISPTLLSSSSSSTPGGPSDLIGTDIDAPPHFALNISDDTKEFPTLLLHSGRTDIHVMFNKLSEMEEWWGIINWQIHSAKHGMTRFLKYIRSSTLQSTPKPSIRKK